MIEKLPEIPQELINDEFAIATVKAVANIHLKINELVEEVNQLSEFVKRT